MSLLATLVKPQAISPSKTVAQSSMTICARSLKTEIHGRNAPRRRGYHGFSKSERIGALLADPRLEEIFVQSLVAAGSCRYHRRSLPHSLNGRPNSHDTHRRIGRPHSYRPSRQFSTKAPVEQQTAAVAESSFDSQKAREDYKELVNTYPEFILPKKTRKTKYEYKSLTHFPLAPRLVLTPDQETSPENGDRVVLPPEDREHKRDVERFTSLVVMLELGRVSHWWLWKQWESLRTPRPRYVNDKTLYRLFRHLTWVEFKHDPQAMQRFLALLNECTNEGLPLTSHIWNTAISFTGRWVREVSAQEVKNSVEMWMRMEDTGHRAGTVTFNVLFDVAIKAGRFALADMVFNELKIRNLDLDRYSRSGLIYSAGKRRDGEAVRKAFQDFVDADEIVDTAIMNTVIVALLRAGEAPAAESVFHKMKMLHEKKFGTLAPTSWQSQRALGALLKDVGHHLRRRRAEHESSFFGAAFAAAARKEEIQHASPIAPNAATYRILIQYHAYTSADIARVTELLTEMHARGFHVHGSVYYHILRGYRIHGGFAFSTWRRLDLEEMWADVLAEIAHAVPAEKQHSGDGNKVIDVDVSSGSRGDFSSPVTKHEPSPSPRSPSEGGLRITTFDPGDMDETISELERPPYFTAGIAIAAVQAFQHCAGRKRMLEVWNEILDRWKDISDDERATVQEVVDDQLSREGMYRP